MTRWLPLILLTLLLTACSSQADREPTLAQAYTGPVSLQVRDELAARATLVATLKHGERIDIIGQRRRFYKVRTSTGAVGWVDGRQLLTTSDMDALKTLAERAAKAPSQGRATVFEPLNVHSVPNRQAPSFFQIAPDAQTDVIAHERHPRVPFNAPEFIPAPPARSSRKKTKKQEVPPPPPGKAPAPPENWEQLSNRGADPADPAPSAPQAAPLTPPMDDWTLIRSRDGRAGWVLTRMLFMAIPDEVAQYAERARIAAYFSIGTVSSHGETKPVWLWATLSQPGAGNDFDNLRIFTWSPRRRRYETSFIERGINGSLPIVIHASLDPATAASFRVVVVEKNGARVERDYALSSFRAHIVSRRPAHPPQPWYVPPIRKRPTVPTEDDEDLPNTAPPGKSLLDRLKDRFHR